ncbi:MAG: hypothetical protein U0Q16_39515 [Bryobacteraceae bacterium]
MGAIRDVEKSMRTPAGMLPGPYTAADRMGPGALYVPVWLAAMCSGVVTYAYVTGFSTGPAESLHLKPVIGGGAALVVFCVHLHLLRYAVTSLFISLAVSSVYALVVFLMRNDGAQRIAVEQAFRQGSLAELAHTVRAGATGWALVAFLISALFHYFWWADARSHPSVFWYLRRRGTQRLLAKAALLGAGVYALTFLKW